MMAAAQPFISGAISKTINMPKPGETLVVKLEEGADYTFGFAMNEPKAVKDNGGQLIITFENRTGMTGGPTQVMRYEHQQLRGLIDSMRSALHENRLEDFFGIGESMMIMLQQHNMKEEQMLYPMIDRALGGDAGPMVQVLREMGQ
jgi:hypothetical protein